MRVLQEDVIFGDINLSEGGPRSTSKSGDHGAGAGGWPTLKHFNKKTGWSGSNYATDDKKTDQAMCDELGHGEKYLGDYVMEKGDTSLCSASPPFKGCSADTKEKSQKLFDKAAKKKAGWYVTRDPLRSMESCICRFTADRVSSRIGTKLEKVEDQKKSKLWPRFPEAEQAWIVQQVCAA